MGAQGVNGNEALSGNDSRLLHVEEVVVEVVTVPSYVHCSTNAKLEYGNARSSFFSEGRIKYSFTLGFFSPPRKLQLNGTHKTKSQEMSDGLVLNG